jgi:hypothetical protein
MTIKAYIVRGISDLVAVCPYTIMGRKILRNKESIEDKCRPIATQQEQQIVQRVKLGRNIALIGVFCPFFWIALFSGASRDFVYFNAMHSGIVIAVGYVILIKGRIDLIRYKKTKRNQAPERSRTGDVRRSLKDGAKNRPRR